MLTFYIVRHGETLFNQKHLMQGWCDSPLTTQGIQMASDLGIRLKDIPFEAAYSSTSERAMDSAELIMKENNTPIPITIRKELKEIHFGIMEGENEYVGYNVPLNVDTIRRRDPIRWTNKKGTDSLIVDTEKRVF